MHSLAPELLAVVTPRIYSLILSSSRLKQQLLPQGLRSSPYEVLDYDSTLVLHDPRGVRATFRRRQRIRFLQDGVSAILDHLWGDGVPLTGYDNTAGDLDDTFVDDGRRHLVIGLNRARGRGETLTFEVEREAMVGFTAAEEWFQTTIDHPLQRLRCHVVFPKERPCQSALVESDGSAQVLPILTMENDQTCVQFQTPSADAHTPYTIQWSW